MSHSPHLSRLGRSPRTLLGCATLLVIVSITCTGCFSQVVPTSSQNMDGIAPSSPTVTASTSQVPSAATIESVAVTATPSPVSRETSPLLPSSELLSYQGEGNYAGMAQFEILYDPAVWELVNGQESVNNHLSNLREPECTFWLHYGAVGAITVDRVILANREWVINQIQAKFISYLFLTDTQGTAYIFGVGLPEDYSDTTKSSCQQMAEEVIDTFSVVGN